jgi:hypothetical protein
MLGVLQYNSFRGHTAHAAREAVAALLAALLVANTHIFIIDSKRPYIHIGR